MSTVCRREKAILKIIEVHVHVHVSELLATLMLSKAKLGQNKWKLIGNFYRYKLHVVHEQYSFLTYSSYCHLHLLFHCLCVPFFERQMAFCPAVCPATLT